MAGDTLLIVVYIIITLAVVRYVCTHGPSTSRRQERLYQERLTAAYSTSTVLNRLKRLNQDYESQFIDYEDVRRYNIPKEIVFGFNGISGPDAIIRQILLDEWDTYTQALQNAKRNSAIYEAYLAECNRIYGARIDPHCIPSCFESLEEYRRFELDEFNSKLINPKCGLSVVIEWEQQDFRDLLSPSKQVYDETDVLKLMSALQHPLDDQREEATRQRNMMSPSLRMKVLKRDGYRCRICGRSANDGVRLEVDHIIPISQGGQTELSNLQTLCWDCNRGKGSQFM